MWFTLVKEGDVINAYIPKDNINPCNLNGEHPVVVISIDREQGTLQVIGCTSNPKYQKYGAIEIVTEPAMPKVTYARVDQGIRVICKSDIIDSYRCQITSQLNLGCKLNK
jgi:hypothetical protein